MRKYVAWDKSEMFEYACDSGELCPEELMDVYGYKFVYEVEDGQVIRAWFVGRREGDGGKVIEKCI